MFGECCALAKSCKHTTTIRRNCDGDIQRFTANNECEMETKMLPNENACRPFYYRTRNTNACTNLSMELDYTRWWYNEMNIWTLLLDTRLEFIYGQGSSYSACCHVNRQRATWKLLRLSPCAPHANIHRVEFVNGMYLSKSNLGDFHKRSAAVCIHCEHHNSHRISHAGTRICLLWKLKFSMGRN